MPLETAPVSGPDCRHAEQAVSDARLISDDDRLDSFAEELAASEVIGLDTEFVRERTFYPRPGLVQVSDGHHIGLLDAVRMPHMAGLGRMLENSLQVKVLHSVGEDLEVLRILTRTLPSPLFDTQIAAAMLGYPLQCRYETLVSEVLAVELPGGKARSDWCKRPLTRDLTTYAAQDVIWLPRLQAILSEALELKGRLSWLQEDCERLLANARDESAEPAVLRVKGAGSLDDDQLEILARLAEWRDHEAQRRDLPRSFVVRDEVMMTLAASPPGPERERQLRALPPPVLRRHGDRFSAILAEAPRTDFERPATLKPLSPEQRERIKLCQAAVTRLAGEIEVEPALLASRREITRLVRGEMPDWMGGWRGQLLGEILTA